LQPAAQRPQLLEQLHARVQLVRMEVVQLDEAECDGFGRRAGEGQTRTRVDLGEHLVEVVAVHARRLAGGPVAGFGPAAQVAKHQDAERLVAAGRTGGRSRSSCKTDLDVTE
jgi:hypothetical protein